MKDTIRRLVPRIIRQSYVLKFAIALVILGLSVGLIGFVGTTMISDSVQENALADQERLAAQEASSIDDWNEQNLRRTSDIAGALNEMDTEEEMQSYLDDVSGDVQGVHLVTDDGEVAVSSQDEATTLSDINFPRGVDLSTTDPQVYRTEAYLDASAGDVNSDRPVVSYYSGVGGEYTLIVSFDLSQYGHDNTGSETTVVVNEDGEIVLDTRNPGFGYQYGAFLAAYGDSTEFYQDASANDTVDYSGAKVYDSSPGEGITASPYDFSDEEFIGAHHNTEMGWTVMSHTTTDEAFGFVNTVNQYGIYATIGGVLLIGLIGAVIGRNTATSIDRLTGKVAEMESGNLDVEFETGRIDNIGRLYDGFAEMRDELKLQITEAEEARAEAEQERERVQRINNELQSAATAYCGVMEEAADGDLTVRMDPYSTENETMQDIGEDFNEMLTEIEATVESLNQFATEVATASEQVTASSEEVRSASEQVSESVQEISDGANQQYDSLRSVDNEMNNLSTTTEEIAASSNEVADVAERTARTGREGQEAASEAIEAVETLEEERESVVAEFEQLQEDVDQIDQLVERVGEIAEQTNMLALNANIEASRSAGGDDDGGFAAVAAEVKELSQDVKAATEEIDDELEGIQAQTSRSAQEVERTSEEIERVGELVTETVEALEEIAEYSQETNDGVQEISAATEEQAASTQEVVAMIDEVATIAEQTTSEAEGVAAAAEEQTTAMTEVSNSANDLTEQAMALSEALDRFETDAPADASVVDLDQDAGDAEIDTDATTFSFEEADADDDDEPESESDETETEDAGSRESITNDDDDETDGGESEPSEAGVTDGDATWSTSSDDETFSLDG